MSGVLILQDDRVKWMRQRVVMALEIPTESFDNHLVESAETAKMLEDFMTSNYSTGSALFFSCNKWVEEVGVEGEPEDDHQNNVDGLVLVDGITNNDNRASASEETKTASSASVKEISASGDVSKGNVEGSVAGSATSEEKSEKSSCEYAINEEGVIGVEDRKVLMKRNVGVDRCVLFMSVEKMSSQMNNRPTVFFIRSNDGDIPSKCHNGNFSSHFEFSLLTGGVLEGIANLMHQVYAPVISMGSVPIEDASSNDVDDALRHELGASMKKFEQQLRHVVQQSQGDVRLNIPNAVITSIEDSAADTALVEEIERALEDWTVVIAGANEAEQQKVNRALRTPLGEIEFWRERSASLSALYEQISIHRVQQMIQVMKLVDSPQLGSFNFHYGELSKTFLEAKDNVKFLTTMERHFRHMSEGSFQTILDSMQSMINGLRMVWVISRHYNSDERMAPLMETIAMTLVKRITEEVKLSQVLSMESKAAKKLVLEARAVLTQWSENYFRMRKRIEDSGSDHRWEFERKALFGKTDYMSDVCGNILEIVEALDHFKVFLGPELKAVTGDAEGIDEVLERVNNLTEPLKFPYEEKIFDKAYEKQWEIIMKRFKNSVAEIEKMTEVFIKESFRKLRSAEGAFELVQNFQKIGADDGSNNFNGSLVGGTGIGTGAGGGGGGGGGTGMGSNTGQPVAGSSIKQQISNRYDDILVQYVHELDALKHLFKTNKEKPPLYKNYPPIAGSIAWARDLYQRAKRPILRFRNHGGLLDDEFGDRVKMNYLEFARAVDCYVNDLFTDWETTTAMSTGEKLKLPVLRSIATYTAQTKLQEKEGLPFQLPPPPYRVNFSYDLKMIIKESRYLDKLGFRIPESALNATLQESKYLKMSWSLNAQLKIYDTIMESLKPIEKILLKGHINDLNGTIKTGFYPLNWTSQRIPQYIEDLEHALLKFSSVVSQVHKNAAMVEDIVTRLSKTLLVQGKDFIHPDGTQLSLDISEFYEIVEVRRITRLDILVEEYKSIGESFLMKVEEVVVKTATGNSPVLFGYYHYWEKCIYNAIAQMVIASMAALMGLLQCKDSPPLFKVLATLNGNDIIVSPALPEVDKQLTKAFRNMAESSKFFIRWMYGTCLKTDPQIINEDEEPYVFSFYQDISKNPQVVKLTLSLTNQTNKVYNMTNKYLDGWRRYDKVTGLWNPKRKQQIEKLRPTCANLDAAMSYFRGIRETVDSQPMIKDIDFLQIDMTLVAIGVAKQSEVWKSDYGDVLLQNSRFTLLKLQEKIFKFENDIVSDTNDIEQLKFVLNVVAEIQNVTQDIELEMMDIIERYRALLRYNIEVPGIEMESAMTIQTRWKQLHSDSKARDVLLFDTKNQFRAVTGNQDRAFRETLADVRRDFLESGPGVSSVSLEAGMELLAEYKLKIGKLMKEKAELINSQNLFNIDVKPYPALQSTNRELEQLEKVYALYGQFKEFQENTSSMLWGDLDMVALQKGSEDIEKLAKKFPKALKDLPTFKLLENKLFNFKESLPLVVSLKYDAMKSRHWQELMNVTGVTFDISLKTLTLNNIFAMELHKYSTTVEGIINQAVQEGKIENDLVKIDMAWRENCLSVVKYKKDGVERGLILRSAEELKIEIEDNVLNLQTIAGSRYVSTFVDRVRHWERILNMVSECLEAWFIVQRKWAYLEGIFIGAEDIRMQLPEESKKFDAIDKSFKIIMSATSKNPNVVDACTADNRLAVLNGLSDRLDNCQKSLSDYLDTKRCAFPRFFFISDDELLSVLGNADPGSIQIHLLKLFDNVKEMQFGRNNKTVEGMSSVEEEGFQCRSAVPMEGPVECWMSACEAEMHSSLQKITKEGVFVYASHPRCEWLEIVLGMVGLVGSQIWWTWEVEDGFRQVAGGNKHAMKTLESKLTGQLTELVTMVRAPLNKITRKKVNTLLIIDVHARDIVDGFVRESVLNAKEFSWESQLRFYWDRDLDDCVIKQCTGTFRYGYEYMGLNGRLVMTPLTDRCYMTLTQALTFKLGGSPAGPAGTGKTETVKDLAKSLALPCFVINCGDGLDYKAMASIFAGLVQVGAWGCFDEFNRINIEVLSVVSAQLRSIQNALLSDRPTCDIGIGGDMAIKRVAGFGICGFFITMNPGYAGRTELPDNLKALFRPVTMIVPDFLQICEIMLFSEGFEGAKKLSKKMTVLYTLSREQLSKQFHYDFGLRALKSVLVMAGGLKRQFSGMSEELVLMRCLRDSNMPKFVFEDVPLFTGLINDLFPGMDCPRVGYEDLKAAAASDLIARGFKCSNETVFSELTDKVIQMYETQLVRHTTMIVGPTGGGKTLVLDTLKNSRLIAENIVVKMFVLNPKAQPLNELYGEMDPVTRDWTDGILSKLFRDLNDRLPIGKENEMRWVVFDGDVDALWVENMNSVMDDNRLLTLPNGERIRLQSHCALICETFDLQYASPATISRCGMVWVDPQNLGYRPYYERWVRLRLGDGVIIPEAKQPAAEFLLALFDRYVPRCIDLILSGMVDGEMGQKLKQAISVTNISMTKQLCCVMDAHLSLDIIDPVDIEHIYIFSVLWSLGAALTGSARIKMSEFLRKLSREPLPDGLLFDYFYDMSARRWEKWQTLIPIYTEPSPFKFYQVMVPTTDSVLYSAMLKTLAPLRPILFVGESGTAKTTVIQKYLDGLDSSVSTKLNINFSSNTTAADVQTNIECNVDRRSGTAYGPPAGKQLIVFVDDLNMPKVDTYGTQQPIALLHFLIGRGTLYDRGKDLHVKSLKDIRYIGAMGPPGGGRNPVDTRFIALFNVLNINPPTEDVLSSIYSSIVTTRFRDFSDGLRVTVSKLTECTLKLYNVILDRMPPTPSKFHYIFNLRDLSRVYEGLCNADLDVITTQNQFVRLWRNECDRVICDRLTTIEDRQLYLTQMHTVIQETYPSSLEYALAEPSLFGDFELSLQRVRGESSSEDPRIYCDMGGYNEVREIFSTLLEEYGQQVKKMTLVLFEAALEHLCRIHRIIRNPRGNALLVGVGGSGKESLTRLAAFCAGYKFFQITLSRGYGETQFKEDLKELYKQLGTNEVLFLFTDAHVVEEGFLEYLNNMLTTGMVPALYAQDERDALCNTIRHEVRHAGIPETPENMWTYYVNKCRSNLHIVFAMSPSGSKLRIRCRNFPGLVSNTVIDWFFPWPADALQKVAEFFLLEEQLPPTQRQAVVEHLVHAHETITTAASQFCLELRRHYYVTPKNYLDFITNYKTQLSYNRKRIDQSTRRLQGGLQKLIEAAEAVDSMQVVLTEKKIVVDEKTENVQALIAVIQEKTAIASTQQEQASVKQKLAEEQAAIMMKQKAKADESLLEALPAVEAAARALDNLDRNDLTELKAFSNPHPAVKSICMMLVCLRPTGDKYEETWNDAKKVLGNSQLLSLLKNYPKDNLTEKQVKKVNKHFTEDVTLEKMLLISKAGHGLLTWVVAIIKYYEVAKNVAPLRSKVKEMEKAQKLTETELLELQTTLSALSQEIDELNEQCKGANAELHVLQSEASLMFKRLAAASKLIDGLTGERTRWSADVGGLELQSTMLVGDCLLGSSFLSYLGAFSTEYRHNLLNTKFMEDIKQRGIPLSSNFSLEGLLTTDATVQLWVAKGLPADQHSIQNGILTTKSSRFPLCIDPQQQAVTWIKRTYAGKNLTVKTLTEPDFIKHLELAIQFGNPFLFENVDEELDPLLDPVLEKSVVKEGNGLVIKLGDKTIEWDENFRLFFTTKLANPHYSPEVMGKTMIINYGVNMDGLTNQLLNVVVTTERSDLETQWADLVNEMSADALLLVTLEDTLLRELSSSQGNILDNLELIATLENTKSTAVEIQEKLFQAVRTKDEISIARSVYKPVAKRGAILYFAEAGLSSINSMYETSLDSFLSVFKTALISAKNDVSLESRMRNMIDTITRQIYDYTCTGIFERHKLLFSFQLTCMVMDGDGLLEKNILDFFFKGDMSLDGSSEVCPATWLNSSGWKDLLFLQELNDDFAALSTDFKKNPSIWKNWYDLEAPELVPMPSGFHPRLKPMHRLCVMRCFRPDRVYNAVKLFVAGILGEKLVQPPVLEYRRIFAQSSPTLPMIFILSPGSDPQGDIQAFSEEMNMKMKFKFIALGQGQGPCAEQLIEAGYKRGHWVLLQNCHLLSSWLKRLEHILSEIKNPHKDFRLWLTTEPTEKFPIGILQRSLKIVTEPPDGLKLNMRATYSRIDASSFDQCPHIAFRPCLYVLTFLHAVVLERRKYGKIGWNVSYDFNDSDFNISRSLLSLYLQKSFEDNDEFIPWGSLKYLIGDAMYGGRVSDDMDRRVLKTYLEEYMGDFIFDDCDKFSFSKVGFDYCLPPLGDLENYTDMVESLPLTNSPSVFGLHPNAEIGYYSNAVKDMWANLIALQPRRVGTGEGISREEQIAVTAGDILSKTPITSMDVGTYDLLQTKAKLLMRNGTDIITPCQIVILQELERWNNLVLRMARTLTDLQRALAGEIGMSDELDSFGDSIFNGYLPFLWRKLCPDTQKPLGSWVSHFIKRYEQYESLILKGDPACLWISGLHIPESYLTALVQSTCRVRGWPLDKSTFYTVVTKYYNDQDLTKLESGCYISGLYLEGAAWDGEQGCLKGQDPKVLVTELPIMQIIPIETSKLKLHNTFKTPVYVTQARRNAMGVGLVFEADLNMTSHASHWVLQGVCLCLNTDA